jgi:hypothetical protein
VKSSPLTVYRVPEIGVNNDGTEPKSFETPGLFILRVKIATDLRPNFDLRLL